MNSRLLWIVVVLLAALAVVWYRMEVFAEKSPQPKPNIVVITGGSGQFWQLIANGAKAAAVDCDAKLKLLMPEKDEDIVSQMQLLSGIGINNVDGVAISPLDAKGQSSLINRLAEQAFVVTVDSDAPESARHTYVGTSNIAAGTICANLVKEALPEGGKIAVLLANLTKQNMIERKQGFEEKIEASDDPQYEVVEYLVDDGDAEKSEQRLQELIEETPDLKCLVGMNAQHGPRILKVLGKLGKLDEIKVVAFDEVEDTLKGVEEGHIYATITQDPYQYGYECVRTLAQLHHSTEAQRPMPGSKSTLSISTRVVRKKDVEDFRSYLKSRLK